MIKTRIKQPAFHPNAGFEVLDCGPKVFAVRRSCKDQEIIAVANLSGERVSVNLPESGLPLTDLLYGKKTEMGTLPLTPYEVVWLSPDDR